MTNSGLRTIYFKYNRSIHWPICYGRSEGDADAGAGTGERCTRPLVSLTLKRGETDARCNPYNVTPKRARNSNIMDSVSPHRNTHARCIYRPVCRCIVDSSPRCWFDTMVNALAKHIVFSHPRASRSPRFRRTKGFYFESTGEYPKEFSELHKLHYRSSSLASYLYKSTVNFLWKVDKYSYTPIRMIIDWFRMKSRV